LPNQPSAAHWPPQCYLTVTETKTETETESH